MSNRKLRKLHVFIISIMVIGIPVMVEQMRSMYAMQQITYSEEEEKLFLGELKQVDIFDQTTLIKTCNYPDQGDEEGCFGFVQKEDGIYKNAQAESGVMKEGVFHPFTYAMKRGEAETEVSEKFTIERKPSQHITDFPDVTFEEDTFDFIVHGDYQSLSFLADKEGIVFDGTSVKVPSSINTFQVTAKEEGDVHTLPIQKTATFTRKMEAETQKETKEETKEETPIEQAIKEVERDRSMLRADFFESTPVVADLWEQNYSAGKKIMLENMTGDYTDSEVCIDVQMINLMDGKHNLKEGETLTSLGANTEDMKTRRNELFQDAIRIPGEARNGACFTKNGYEILSEWEENLTIMYPNKEGIFIYRWKLTSPDYPDGVPTRVSPTETTTKWRFDPAQRFVGIDMVPPLLDVLVKGKTDAEDRLLSQFEILSSGTKLKLKADSEYAGMKKLRYRFDPYNDDIIDVEWTEIANPGTGAMESEIEVPAYFVNGGTLYIEAIDGVGINGETNKTAVNYQLVAPRNSTMVYLPKEMEEWGSEEKAKILLVDPLSEVPAYDKVILYFTDEQGVKVKDPIEIEKSEFVEINGNKTYELTMDNGAYTITAELVKTDGSVVDNNGDDTRFTTKVMIDHRAELTATPEAKKVEGLKEILPVKLDIMVGPSGARDINITCKNVSGTSWDEKIKTRAGVLEYKHEISVNGTCDYSVVNNAGKESAHTTIKTADVGDLQNPYPVLDIQATDSAMNQVLSGEDAQNYVYIKANNVNDEVVAPNDKIQMCIDNICSDYIYGESILINKNAQVEYRTKPGNIVVGEFAVKVVGNIKFGTINVEDENEYKESTWHKDDKNVIANIEGGDPDVYLAFAIDQGEWISTERTQASTSIMELAGNSGKHVVEFRGYQGDLTGPSKTVYVNIDKKLPTLATTQTVGEKKNLANIHLQASVGGSGIASLNVKTPLNETLNLASLLKGDGTIADYQATSNGTYVFTMSNGVKESTTATIVVSELNENNIHVSMSSDNKPYEGTWTNQNVLVKLSGGLVDMKDFDHYECKIGDGEWTRCEAEFSIVQEGDQTYQFSLINQDGDRTSISVIKNVRIDKTAPNKPAYTFQAMNTSSIAKFLNALSFVQAFNEYVKLDISSVDNLSDVTIFYQLADEEGNYETDKTNARWKSYESSIKLDKEGVSSVVAYACDEANNCVDGDDSDGVMIDLSAPLLHGILSDDVSGYIPRVIRYEDILSGMDDEKTTLHKDKTAITTAQGMKLSEVGVYEFALYDKVGNLTSKTFELKKIPSPNEVDGDDAWKDVIDEIQDELDKNKDTIDEDTKKEIEEIIKDLEDVFQKQRVDKLFDEETNSSITGIDGTTFPKDGKLTIRRITDELSVEEIADMQALADQKKQKIQDVYEVKIMLADKEMELRGSATMHIQDVSEVEHLAFVSDEMKDLDFTIENKVLEAVITSTGRYSLANDSIDDNGNSNDNGNGNYNGNGNGNSVLGNYAGRTNTGDDSQGLGQLMLFLMSGLVLCITMKQCSKKRL